MCCMLQGSAVSDWVQAINNDLYGEQVTEKIFRETFLSSYKIDSLVGYFLSLWSNLESAVL